MKTQRNWFRGRQRRSSVRGTEQKARRRPTRYRFEHLEWRTLLAGSSLAPAASLHCDVNGDGVVTPLDALVVINDLSLHGPHAVLASSGAAKPATMSALSLSANSAASSSGAKAAAPANLDVNSDNFVTPLDALSVINRLAAPAVTPEVKIRLQAVDLAGNPITHVAQGTDFKLQAFVQDVRSTSTAGTGGSPPDGAAPSGATGGVFASYLDAGFFVPNGDNNPLNDTTLSSILSVDPGPPPSHTTFGTQYQNAKSEDTQTGTPTQIIETGATAGFTQLGNAEWLLWTIPVHTSAAGTVDLVPKPASQVGHENLVFGQDTAVPNNQVTFVASTLTVDAVTLPGLSINDVSLNEGNSGTTTFTFTVTLSQAAAQNVTVNFATANGTATLADHDYNSASGTLTFTPGGALTRTVTVAVNGDTTFESDETFTVNLSGASANATITKPVGTGTIKNDDAKPALSIGGVSLNEGNSGTTAFNFTVTLTGSTELPVTVNYATADGSAKVSDNDYQAASGTLTFNPGQTTQTATVLVNGDTKNEPDELFTVNLSNATNATIFNATGTGMIKNDDPSPTMSISDVSLAEGNSGTTAFVFNVTLSAASSQQVSAQFATANGTATIADNDYQANSGLVTFAPGQTTQTITVLVNGDTKIEPDETFTVTLTSPTNATFAKAVGTGTIQNDDSAGPSLSINDVSLNEGNSGTTSFTFNVTLSQAATQNVTVNFATADGTAKLSDSDYQSNSGQLTFTPGGATTQTVTVLVNGDTTFESAETFTVNLSGAINASITKAVGTGTITNDDAAPTLSISDVTQDGGSSGTTAFVFTVTLTGATELPATVHFATADGTAKVSDNDYVAKSGTLTFTPGQTTQTISVQVNGDPANESAETFTVNLDTPVAATLVKAQGVGTILSGPSLSISDVSQNEGNAGTTAFTFTVTLSGNPTQDVTVNFATADGTAKISGNDYQANSGQLTFALGGQTTQTITVLVNGDTINETNETFTVNLSGATNAALGKSVGIGTILNDDPAPTLSINDVAKPDGSSGTTPFTFTVSLTGATEQTVTVQYATANGTAKSPRDYAAASGTLTFAPGVTSQDIVVQVKADTFFKPDRTFTVNLSNVVNATLTNTVGTGTIQNDDPPSNFQPSSLAGVAYVDVNNNGLLGSAEKRLPGVTITLVGVDVSSNDVNMTQVTTATGTFEFDNLVPGDYTITETQPAGFMHGTDSVGTLGGTVSKPGQFTIHIDPAAAGDGTGYNFAERGLRPGLISMRDQLASTPSNNHLTSLNTTAAPMLLSLDAGWNGTLTAQATGAPTGAQPQLTLLNNELQPVSSSTVAGSTSRLDYQGTPGQPYFLKVSGANPSVDLKLTNLVSQNGTTVTVHGTSADELFEMIPGKQDTLIVNGVTYQFDPAKVASFVFDGGGGHDSIALTAAGSADTANFSLGSGTLAGSNYTASVSNVQSIVVNGAAGKATLRDSAANDHLLADGDWLTLSNDLGFATAIHRFASASAGSKSGGVDTKDIRAIDFALSLEGNWL